LRPKLACRYRRAGEGVQAAIIAVETERLEVELHVRAAAGKRRAAEAAGQRRAEAQDALAAEHVVHAYEELAPWAAGQIVEAERLAEFQHQPRLQMILKMPSNSRQRMEGPDACCRQLRRISDARQLQDLRRTDGAGCQHDFSVAAKMEPVAAPPAMDAVHLIAVKFEALDRNVREDAQIRAAHRRTEEGARAGGAAALARGQLKAAHAFLRRPVEIGIAGKTCLDTSLHEARHKLKIDGRIFHAKGALSTVKFALAPYLRLDGLEGRKHV